MAKIAATEQQPIISCFRLELPLAFRKTGILSACELRVSMSTLPGVPDIAARLAARFPNGRRPQIMHHKWESLLFLHWRCSPSEIQKTLPPGLTVDTFEGDAYLAITPFFMRNIRPVAAPPLPWFSFFQELNVRTYAVDSTGAPGVWFYSLDCSRSLAVLGARLAMALPYFSAEMSGWRNNDVQYSSRRRGTKSYATYRYHPLGPERETQLQSLEFFLLERYYLFAYRRETGALLRGQVSHAPYRYRDVELTQLSTVPAQLDGFNRLAGWPDHICTVDGLEVKIFAPEKVAGSLMVKV